MNLKLRALTKSPWVFHLSTGSCNNCDIEILDLLTPRFDVERFGILLVGSVRHADALLVTGALSRKATPRVKRIYEQIPKPCVVIAVGTCSLGQGIFKGSYNMPRPVDEVIREVDPNAIIAYIPGCPPKPEAMIAGAVKALSTL